MPNSILNIDTEARPEQTMTCMEVIGGNQATRTSVRTLGLDAWIYSQPFEAAVSGGDVHYISSCATGRITRVLVADVSGHGAPVSGTANKLRGLMRRHVNHIDQSRFVEQMNVEFSSLAEGGCFATAVVATFFAPQSDFMLTNAGHPAPLIYRANLHRWEILEGKSLEPESTGPSNLPLGLFDGVRFSDRRFVLQAGDVVLIYTDSLIESRNEDDTILGMNGLLDIVQSLDPSNPAELPIELRRRIREIRPDNLTEDDVTLVLLRATGAVPAVPIKNRLEAPFRFLWACMKAALSLRPLPLPEFTLANLGGSLIDPLSHIRTARDEEPTAERQHNQPMHP